MRTYFADTSFLVAISSRRDQYHVQAVAWQRALANGQNGIVTSEAVLWEWLNALADASTRGMAAEGYRRVHDDPGVEVVPFQPELVEAAVGLYRSRDVKNGSLTDCLSFVIMDRKGLTEALTTDRHFEQAGLKAVMLDRPDL